MKYTDFTLKDTIVHISRVHHSKHFRLSIHDDGEVYGTYPWYSNKSEFLAFLETRYNWIIKAKEKIKEKSNLKINRYDKDALLDLINTYVDRYIRLFNKDGYNIVVKRVSLRNMSTRLGSCTPSTKSIRFSSKLCSYSDRYIEYVVIHELTHLVECNHSKRFWDIVKRYIGDYKKIVKYNM